MVGRLFSFWEGTFSGALLNFRGVSTWDPSHILITPQLTSTRRLCAHRAEAMLDSGFFAKKNAGAFGKQD